MHVAKLLSSTQRVAEYLVALIILFIPVPGDINSQLHQKINDVT